MLQAKVLRRGPHYVALHSLTHFVLFCRENDTIAGLYYVDVLLTFDGEPEGAIEERLRLLLIELGSKYLLIVFASTFLLIVLVSKNRQFKTIIFCY